MPKHFERRALCVIYQMYNGGLKLNSTNDRCERKIQPSISTANGKTEFYCVS